MSHEIRTPMNGILGFSQMLKEVDLTVKEKEDYIEAIDKSTNQLLHIITDILDISKIEAGQETTLHVSFNLNELLDEVYTFFYPLATQKNLKFTLIKSFSSDGEQIESDPVKLRQILDNLIGNAIKFTEKGSVELLVSLVDKRINFSISDSGIGIDPSLHESIFDRFRQVELTNSRKYGGTGLGLSLSKSYVEMLNGTIGVKSVPGYGSTFKFEIPLVQASIQRLDKLSDKSKQSFLNAWKGKTILLAEDEEINLFYLQTVLKPTGINIITAVNGLEAVEHCKKNNDISLVLMDIKMPEMGWNNGHPNH